MCFHCIQCICYIYSFGRHSNSFNIKGNRCGYCVGEFELVTCDVPDDNFKPLRFPATLTEWYNVNGPSQNPVPCTKLTMFGLYVKDNYSKVVKKNPSARHINILQFLLEQYNIIKKLKQSGSVGISIEVSQPEK